MFGKTPDPLSNSEWKVMKIVWEQKSCAARDVYQKAGSEQGWAPTTVKTILRRLVVKGYLTTTQIGNSFLYRPVRPAMKALLNAADTLLENALDGTVGPLLAHMVKRGNLSAAELAELKSLLDQASADGEAAHDNT
jgi:BlaI family transcriptional regulator, penicillinase repressor